MTWIPKISLDTHLDVPRPFSVGELISSCDLHSIAHVPFEHVTSICFRGPSHRPDLYEQRAVPSPKEVAHLYLYYT